MVDPKDMRRGSASAVNLCGKSTKLGTGEVDPAPDSDDSHGDKQDGPISHSKKNEEEPFCKQFFLNFKNHFFKILNFGFAN